MIPGGRHSLAAVALAIACIVRAVRAEPPATAAMLRVGTSGDYSPFSFRDASGNLTGFDVSVAQRLAADLGRPVQFVPLAWPDLVTQLQSGDFDIAMSGVTVRPDRAVVFNFSRPYVVTGAVAVVRAGDRTRYRTLADLDRKRIRIAVNAGGHLEQVARQSLPHAQVKAISNNLALPALLERGEVEAVLSDGVEARTWKRGQFAFIGPLTHDRKAYALPRASTGLQRQIDQWLAAREADGWLDQERQRWLGPQAAMTEQQAGIEALVSALDLRLQLMPIVAAVKRREQLPIDDPAQEARVLERVRADAVAAGLNADDVAALFRLLMETAKLVERSTDATPPASSSLADVRAAIAAASTAIVGELARCQPWLHSPHGRDQLATAVHGGLGAPGVTASQRADLAAALSSVRRATP